MAEPFYEPLSYLDASFLALETPNTHMHVAGVVVFDAGPLVRPEGGIAIDTIKSHIAAKLKYVPRYRQRLAHMPLNRAPVWIDDAHFDLDYHVRHTSLPRPGSDTQLKALAGRIVSQPLDRARPLWELWVVEGLEGDRFALIAKIHHCMIDGISGVDLTTILLDVTPDTEPESPEPWDPRPAPSGTQLAVAEIAKATRRVVDHLTSLTDPVEHGKEIGESILRRLGAAIHSLRSGWLTPAARTPLNPDIGPNRRFDWTDIPLDATKAVKDALGGTVNDVVLATVAGAVRDFLTEHRGFDVDGIDFRVMAPVSVRRPEQRGTLGNQVAMWLVRLPLDEPDPAKRLRIISEETRRLKAEDHALGAATLVELSRGTPLTILSLASRLAGHVVRPFNMTVTNVPGPQFPMYLLGATMLANYPIVPLWAQHGVGVALFSYNGVMHWGIHADWDTLPDSADFVAAIHRSFDALRAAAERTR